MDYRDGFRRINKYSDPSRFVDSPVARPFDEYGGAPQLQPTLGPAWFQPHQPQMVEDTNYGVVGPRSVQQQAMPMVDLCYGEPEYSHVLRPRNMEQPQPMTELSYGELKQRSAQQRQSHEIPIQVRSSNSRHFSSNDSTHGSVRSRHTQKSCDQSTHGSVRSRHTQKSCDQSTHGSVRSRHTEKSCDQSAHGSVRSRHTQKSCDYSTHGSVKSRKSQKSCDQSTHGSVRSRHTQKSCDQSTHESVRSRHTHKSCDHSTHGSVKSRRSHKSCNESTHGSVKSRKSQILSNASTFGTERSRNTERYLNEDVPPERWDHNLQSNAVMKNRKSDLSVDTRAMKTNAPAHQESTRSNYFECTQPCTHSPGNFERKNSHESLEDFLTSADADENHDDDSTIGRLNGHSNDIQDYHISSYYDPDKFQEDFDEDGENIRPTKSTEDIFSGIHESDEWRKKALAETTVHANSAGKSRSGWSKSNGKHSASRTLADDITQLTVNSETQSSSIAGSTIPSNAGQSRRKSKGESSDQASSKKGLWASMKNSIGSAAASLDQREGIQNADQNNRPSAGDTQSLDPSNIELTLEEFEEVMKVANSSKRKRLLMLGKSGGKSTRESNASGKLDKQQKSTPFRMFKKLLGNKKEKADHNSFTNQEGKSMAASARPLESPFIPPPPTLAVQPSKRTTAQVSSSKLEGKKRVSNQNLETKGTLSTVSTRESSGASASGHVAATTKGKSKSGKKKKKKKKKKGLLHAWRRKNKQQPPHQQMVESYSSESYGSNPAYSKSYTDDSSIQRSRSDVSYRSSYESESDSDSSSEYSDDDDEDDDDSYASSSSGDEDASQSNELFENESLRLLQAEVLNMFSQSSSGNKSSRRGRRK